MQIDLDDLERKIEDATSGVLIFSVESARQFVAEIRSGRLSTRELARVTASDLAGVRAAAMVGGLGIAA